MAWFKTDDKLPDHRKARAVRKSHPTKRRDASAFGVWALAGAWSDDGFVPLEILEDWDDDAFELAERLVAAGLWHPTQRDGEPGYVFHDWADHNPVRDENDPSTAGTFGNHIRWHVQRRIVAEDCDHCPKEAEPDRGDIAPNRPDDRPDIAPPSGASLPTRPDPTRPDPTRPEPGPNPARAATPVASEPDGIERFAEFWETYGKKVDRKAAEQKWRLALKKPGVTADLLIAAAAAYVLWERQNNEGGRYIMGPAKWLLNERWTDERPARRPEPQTNVQAHLALVRELEARERGDQAFPMLGGA